MHILPPGVDTLLWQPGDEDAKPDDGVVRILFTGYAFERKGGDLLLRVAQRTGAVLLQEALEAKSE